MKKYTILALAMVLCITGLTGCRRNKRMADGIIPNTTAATYATTMPTTHPTTVPATTETRPHSSTNPTNDNMVGATNPNGRSRSRSVMPGVG